MSGLEILATLVSVRSAVFLAASVGALSCGRNVTDPSIMLGLNPGLYSFSTSTTGGAVSCVVTGQAPPSALSFQSVPEKTGPDWTFRNRSDPTSTFELRVSAFAIRPAGWQINGFILGNATIAGPPPISVAFGKLSIVSGSANPERIDGSIIGQVQFADGLGNLLTCIDVPWTVVRIGNVPQ